MPHLAYVGDAELGENVNFSAGAITVNYDGREKHKTEIKDGAFIGSDVMLVAPVTIGEESMIGAGSVITKDVPSKALGIERNNQKNVEGYVDRKRKMIEQPGKKRCFCSLALQTKSLHLMSHLILVRKCPL